MSTVTKVLVLLLGIILISAVACGSDQSPGDIVAEPEPAAIPTSKAAEPQVADGRSDQAEEMDRDPEPDHSERTTEMDKDPEPDSPDQAMEMDSDDDASDGTVVTVEDSGDDASDETVVTVEDSGDDASDETVVTVEDSGDDASDETVVTVEDSGDDASDETVVTVEDSGDDASDETVVTVEDSGDDASDETVVTVEDSGDDASDETVVTVEDSGDDSSDETVVTVEDSGDDSSDETVVTVEEGPEPSENETVKVGRDVGERVLDFSITLEDGTVRTTQDLLSAGRPVFIYFFTTWCPVCRKDLTELQAIYPEYADAVDFIVVGQDPSEPLGELVAYRDGRGQSWPVALAGPRMLADLRITSQAFKLAFNSGGLITYRAGFGNGNPDVWRGIIADLASG